jgi:hypothetical protein
MTIQTITDVRSGELVTVVLSETFTTVTATLDSATASQALACSVVDSNTFTFTPPPSGMEINRVYWLSPVIDGGTDVLAIPVKLLPETGYSAITFGANSSEFSPASPFYNVSGLGIGSQIGFTDNVTIDPLSGLIESADDKTVNTVFSYYFLDAGDNYSRSTTQTGTLSAVASSGLIVPNDITIELAENETISNTDSRLTIWAAQSNADSNDLDSVAFAAGDNTVTFTKDAETGTAVVTIVNVTAPVINVDVTPITVDEGGTINLDFTVDNFTGAPTTSIGAITGNYTVTVQNVSSENPSFSIVLTANDGVNPPATQAIPVTVLAPTVVPKLWPFIPQYNATETLEWSTEILRARGKEQRIARRSQPRHRFSYEYHFDPYTGDAATQLARKYGHESVSVPLWTDGKSIGLVSSGDTTLAFDTTQARFVVGGQVFLLSANDAFEVAEIAAINTGSLELATQVVNTYPDAYVTPVMQGHFAAAFRMQKPAGEYNVAFVEFITDDLYEVNATHNYPAYRGRFVWTVRSEAEAHQESIQRENTDNSSTAGKLFFSPDYNYSVAASSVKTHLHDYSELWEFREFIHSLKGRQKSFYLPRYVRDFKPFSTILSGDSFITIQANQYVADDYTGDIAILLKDGSQIYKEVTGWTPIDATSYQMDLSEAVGTNIDLNEIEMITQMPLVRLNTDKIKFTRTNGGGYPVNLPVFEVPE